MKTGQCYFRVGDELWLASSFRDGNGVVSTVSELIDPLFFVGQ